MAFLFKLCFFVGILLLIFGNGGTDKTAGGIVLILSLAIIFLIRRSRRPSDGDDWILIRRIDYRIDNRRRGRWW